MGLNSDLVISQTPFDEDEIEGLLIPTITLKKELDEFEQLNIQDAVKWSSTVRVSQQSLLTDTFVKRVHKKMYGEVWAWAGRFRKTNKNIGVDWHQVPAELKQVLNDCKYWIDHETFPPDEIAVRFKHRLVSIHCFANGNGRHSRLMADLIAERIFQRPAFSWNGSRESYIKAVKAADMNDINPLLAFARS